MATPPDFTSGQILTAAQMNAVGLWLVKTQTIGTGVSSVLVPNAFNADYTNYRILITGGSANTPAALGLQMGTGLAGTGYYSGITGTNYSGGASTGNDSNAAHWTIAGSAMPDGLALDVMLTEPFLARKTGLAINSRIDYRTNGAGTMGNGFHNSATSYTGFALIIVGASITGGTIQVYGIRD
jgi:hypothetical protein